MVGNNLIPVEGNKVYTLCQFQSDGGTTGLRIHDQDGSFKTGYLPGHCTIFDGTSQLAELAPGVIYQFCGDSLASCMSPSGTHARLWGTRRTATPHTGGSQPRRMTAATEISARSVDLEDIGLPPAAPSQLRIRTPSTASSQQVPKSLHPITRPPDRSVPPDVVPEAEVLTRAIIGPQVSMTLLNHPI